MEGGRDGRREAVSAGRAGHTAEEARCCQRERNGCVGVQPSEECSSRVSPGDSFGGKPTPEAVGTWCKPTPEGAGTWCTCKSTLEGEEECSHGRVDGEECSRELEVEE